MNTQEQITTANNLKGLALQVLEKAQQDKKLYPQHRNLYNSQIRAAKRVLEAPIPETEHTYYLNLGELSTNITNLINLDKNIINQLANLLL